MTPHFTGGDITDNAQHNPSESNFPRLAAPARRALLGAGYTQLDQLAQATEAEIRQLHGIGPNALDQLRRALSERGFTFAEAPRRRE